MYLLLTTSYLLLTTCINIHKQVAIKVGLGRVEVHVYPPWLFVLLGCTARLLAALAPLLNEEAAEAPSHIVSRPRDNGSGSVQDGLWIPRTRVSRVSRDGNISGPHQRGRVAPVALRTSPSSVEAAAPPPPALAIDLMHSWTTARVYAHDAGHDSQPLLSADAHGTRAKIVLETPEEMNVSLSIERLRKATLTTYYLLLTTYIYYFYLWNGSGRLHPADYHSHLFHLTARCCRLPAACYLLPATCCPLPYLLVGTCCLLVAVYYLLPAGCCLLPAACCPPPAAQCQ